MNNLKKIFKKYICLLFIVGLLIVSQQKSYSQYSTSSPNSRYGIGELARKGTVTNRSMGGTGLALRPINHINMLNPASYTAFNNDTFIFEVGIDFRSTQLATDNENQTFNDVNFNYLAFGFPITKWWASSFGLRPFSSVGYEINHNYTDNQIGKISSTYTGLGGISSFYFGHSFRIHRLLSVGVNANYLFGKQEQNVWGQIIDGLYSQQTNVENDVVINDFYLEYGLQSSFLFAGKTLNIGIRFDNKQNINAYKTSFIYTVQSLNGNYFVDTLKNVEDELQFIEIPTNIGVGIAYQNNKNFVVGIDGYMQDWTGIEYLGNNVPNFTSYKYAGVGLQYTPDATSPSYHKRIRYRAGAYYSDYYLQIDDNQFSDMGVTIGFGFPVSYLRTMFNFSLEAGRRATPATNLLSENYLMVSFSLTKIETWFKRRKYD